MIALLPLLALAGIVVLSRWPRKRIVVGGPLDVSTGLQRAAAREYPGRRP